ncbi:Ig-like domain-containing protein [uncultured Deinococcus sp.]|uniref:Ig-like domain-containing protein n=1 Tax=uncultured Deinococcus sp. TaxID=158789 RepID=UPI00258BEFDA|nr:Ig-like domain-containing protein [uncultured Deinococcus sp.]
MALKSFSACSALLLGALLVGCSDTSTPADTTNPTLTLTSSANPVTTSTFTLKADATDNVAVTKVEFYEGTTKLGEDTSAPYELPLSAQASQNGQHTYTATAYDAAGNKASANAVITINISTGTTNPTPTPGDTTNPTVTLTSSANPVTTSTFTLKADATDNVAVTKVEFYEGTTKLGEDTAAPYELPVTGLNALQNGSRTYTATAYDAAGNKASASTSVTVSLNAGTAPVQGTVVDQNIGAPVVGSVITVSQDGLTLGTVPTDAQGNFTLTGLPAGTYDLKARKSGLAGYDLYGVVIGSQAQTIKLIQRPAFDTTATTNGARLKITRADGSAISGATFTDKIDFRISTTDDSDHVGPMRIVYAQLGRTPGSAGITGSTTASNYSYSPPQDQPRKVDTGAVTSSGNFTAGFGSAAGETVYLEVMAVDYNYNYTRYVIPIKLINTAATAGSTVVAPTQAAATAFTLKQEGSWTTPYQVPGTDAATPDAAPNGSGVFVEVRWCYTDTSAAAKPFAFDIERSGDGATFTKVGTVGGGTPVATCSADQATRPYSFRDTGAELSAGKTFTYRVKARGANTADSNTTQTTPLAQFSPRFIAPADETTGVSTNPTFVLGQNQTDIGADGAAYNLRIRDLMTQNGYNLPAPVPNTAGNALIRVEEGTGDSGNKIPAGQSLVFTSSGTVFRGPTTAGSVLTDTSGRYLAAKPNRVQVDTAAHTVSLPWNVFVAAPLQALRPYKWEMYSGVAYKYAPAENNRISAYSVYTWAPDADGNLVAPINQSRPVNINWDFITGPQ